MNPDLAKELYQASSFIFLLNVQCHALDFGIDLNTWRTGPNCLGLKLIPPGFHIVTLSIGDRYGSMAPLSSFLFHTTEDAPLTMILNYDTKNEDWSVEQTYSKCLELREKAQAIDSMLGPYDYKRIEQWKHLSQYITPSLLKRILPESPSNTALPYKIFQVSSMTSSPYAAIALLKESSIQSLDEDSFIRFPLLDFKSLLKEMNATADQITHTAMDKSLLLEHLLEKYYFSDIKELLGEFQLSFLLVLICQNLEGLEHWKSIFSLLCHCEESMLKFMDGYNAFLDVIWTHLDQISETSADIMLLSEDNNIIISNLEALFMNIDDLVKTEPKRLEHLYQKSLMFQKKLSTKYHWDLKRERQLLEDEPIIYNEEAL